MNRFVYLSSGILALASQAVLFSQAGKPVPTEKPADGVYAVIRDSEKEKDVLPLKSDERLVVHHYRFLKPEDREPPRYVVVHSAPDVALGLAGEPKAIKEGDEVVGILLTLEPKQAAALERLTREHRSQLAIVLGGEVVTIHKIRATISDGKVQITSCAAGGAQYLLKQLEAYQHKR